MKKILMLLIILLGSSLFALAQTSAELLDNCGFEQSKSLYPWVVETTKGGISVSGPNENGSPHGGNRYVVLGGTNKEKDSIEQTVIIPQNTVNLVLSFALRIKATGNDDTPHDFFKVSFQGEAIDETLVQYNNTNACEWQIISLPNLTAYAGRLVTLRFDVETDGTKPTKFCIDDVSLTYTPGTGSITPNLEFMSPHHGCLLPISTISGAVPIRILTDSPDGIQSLTASIDDEVIAATTEPIMEIPINWSSLTPGEHVLTGELIDPIGRIKVKRCTISSTNILEGADFELGGGSMWVGATPDKATRLIKEVGINMAYEGESCAVFPSGSRYAQALEQMIGIPIDAQDTLTLSFLYKAEWGSKLNPNGSLSVHFVDVDTGQDFLAATVYPSETGWMLNRVAISMSELGMSSGRDYYLRIASDTNTGLSTTVFYVDDVALYVYSNTLYSGGYTPDEDGDVPGEDSPGCMVDVDLHRDPPNKCNCGHYDHAPITITLTGFTSLPAEGCNISTDILKVKFYKDKLSKGAYAEDVCLHVDGGTAYITCKVPNCRNPNYLGEAFIKVKVINNGVTEKVWTKNYFVSEDGSTEQGFFYGFPEKPANFQLLQGSNPSVLGGELQKFKMKATNLYGFKQMTDGGCASETNTGYLYLPKIFAGDGSGAKVRVKGDNDNLKNTSNTCTYFQWESCWTGDGAPAVCTNETPCITTAAPVWIRALNPDNIKSTIDGFDFKWKAYRGELLNAVQFTVPSTPSFTTGAEYGPVNTVGFGYNAFGNPEDIAICSLENASNWITFHGSNVYRISKVRNSDQPDDPDYWYDDLSGPTWNKTADNWGKQFKAWAPAHAKGDAIPIIETMDGRQITLGDDLSLTYIPSFAPYESTNCINNMGSPPNNCDSTDPTCSVGKTNLVTPTSYWLERFKVGPGEDPPRTVVTSCLNITNNGCSFISVVPQIIPLGTDNDGTQIFDSLLRVGYRGSTLDQGALYGVSTTSDYGVVETKGVTFQFLAPQSGNLVVMLSANPTSGPPPLQVHFTTTVSGGSTCSYNYRWDFGDGCGVTGPDQFAPSHTYTAEGIYEAKVLVDCGDQSGTASVIINVTTVSGTLKAAPKYGLAPLTVTFTCNPKGGSGVYSNYYWDFGDGETQVTSSNISAHEYEDPGHYNATVIVTDTNGLPSSPIQSDGEIVVFFPVTASANPTSGSAPLSVIFTASASGGTGTYTYGWDFKDGSPAVIGNPVTYVFNSMGIYNVLVAAHDTADPWNEGSAVVTVVIGGSTPEFSTSLSASPSAGIAPLAVQLTAAPQFGITPYRSYKWTFGDGTSQQTTTNNFVNHTYQTSGTYYPSVTVTDWNYATTTGATTVIASTAGQRKISGRITRSSAGMPNIDVILTGAIPSTVKTDSLGYYQFSGLPNGTYNVEPNSGNYEFSPANANITINGKDAVNVDFEANPIIIEGMVATSQGNGVAGIKMEISSLTGTTNVAGKYAFTNIAPGDYTLEPSEEDAARYTFDPPNRKIKIEADDKPHKDQNFKVTPK